MLETRQGGYLAPSSRVVQNALSTLLDHLEQAARNALSTSPNHLEQGAPNDLSTLLDHLEQADWPR